MADFKKIGTNNVELQKVQENVGEALQPIIKSAILNGAQLDNISLASGNNTIEHRLGKKLSGWIVVKKDSGALIYEVESDFPSRILVLNSSSQCNISLWVY